MGTTHYASSEEVLSLIFLIGLSVCLDRKPTSLSDRLCRSWCVMYLWCGVRVCSANLY